MTDYVGRDSIEISAIRDRLALLGHIDQLERDLFAARQAAFSEAVRAGTQSEPLGKRANTPAEDACIDIYNDLDADEVNNKPRSTRFAWEVGRQLSTLQSSETNGDKP